MDTLLKLKKLKEKYDKKYYDEGIQVIKDEEYDILDTFIKQFDSTEKIPAKKGKVKLPVNMFSLNKVRKYKKTNLDCVVLDKLDGVSCLMYKNEAYTRGDGFYGQNISNMFSKIYNVDGYAIRGELVIDKNVFEKKYKHLYSNTRTMVCSFVNKNENNKDIDFVAYEIISMEQDNDMMIQDQLDFLKKHNIPTVYSNTVNKAVHSDFEKILEERLKHSKFDIDGLVICFKSMIRNSKSLEKNPKYAVAFKKDFSGEITTVTDIVWNIGKSGNFTPIIHVEPVKISGSVIKKISGHNVSYLESRGIGIGSEIEIIKSGQVIPFVLNVHKTSNVFKIPEECVAGKLLDFLNDKRVVTKNILYFAKTLNISGIGVKKAEEFCKKGLTPQKIICEGLSSIQFLLGTGKNNENIYNNIKQSLLSADSSTILLSSGLLPSGIGKIKVSNIEIDKFENYKNLILDWKKNWQIVTTETNLKQNKEEVVNKKVICITGTRNKKVENALQQHYTVKYTITKETEILVYFGDYVENKKIQKAKEKNILIVSFEDIIKNRT